MSDWDERRKLQRSQSYKPLGGCIKIYGPFYCCKCGKSFVSEKPLYTIIGAVTADGELCEVCLKAEPKSKATPPPPALQITIEEKYGTKEGGSDDT